MKLWVTGLGVISAMFVRVSQALADVPPPQDRGCRCDIVPPDEVHTLWPAIALIVIAGVAAALIRRKKDG